MSADHPLARGALDLLLGSESGNSAFGMWKRPGAEAVLLETILVVECVAPAAVLGARAAARHGDVSDAGPAVVAAQLADREPCDELDSAVHCPLRSDRRVEQLVALVEDAVDLSTSPH
jgi:predicted kinase